MNGIILGMKHKEVQARFDQIAEFAEVRAFLDTPVKRYSSGMKVRLAFAVAAHLDPDILIVDEVLAVGDAGFQKKCLGKMGEVVASGRTVLFVSHQMQAIQNLCRRAILLEDGRLKQIGPAGAVVASYLRDHSPGDKSSFRRTETTVSSGSGEAECVSADICSLEGRVTPSLRMGEGFAVRLVVRAQSGVRDLAVTINMFDQGGTYLSKVCSLDCNDASYRIEPGREHPIMCSVRNMNLLPGIYTCSLLLRRAGSGELLDRVGSALRFEVLSCDVPGHSRSSRPGGMIFLKSEWR
jgi:lipopolysaccharide transport system ATP-binding protein